MGKAGLSVNKRRGLHRGSQTGHPLGATEAAATVPLSLSLPAWWLHACWPPSAHSTLSLPFPDSNGVLVQRGQLCTIGFNTHPAEKKGARCGHGEDLMGWGQLWAGLLELSQTANPESPTLGDRQAQKGPLSKPGGGLREVSRRRAFSPPDEVTRPEAAREGGVTPRACHRVLGAASSFLSVLLDFLHKRPCHL